MQMISLLLAYATGVAAVLYFFTIRPGKKKHRQTREMHASVAVGDRVTSIGGMIGTVTERDEERVRLLIDEKTGTTLWIVIYAVQSILEKADA